MGWCGHAAPASAVIQSTAQPVGCYDDLSNDARPLLPPALRAALWIGRLLERVALWLHASLRDRPKQSRAFIALAIVVYIGFHTSHAATGATLLNQINNNLQADTAGFFPGSFQLANAIFSVVGCMVVLITLADYLAEYKTLSGVGRVILKVILMIWVPFTILQGAEVILPGWYGMVLRLGQTLTGVAIAPNPDGVFTMGANLAKAMLTTAGQKIYNDAMMQGVNIAGIFMDVVLLLVAIFAAVVLFVTFTMLAVELLVALAQCYIGLSIGAYQLGWSAARATSGYAMAYWGLVQAVFTRIFVIMAIIAVGLKEGNAWIAQINNLGLFANGSAFSNNILTMLQIPLLGVAFYLLASKVTDLAVGQLTGRPAMSGAGMVGQGAGGFVGGMMTGSDAGRVTGLAGAAGALRGAMSGSSTSRGYTAGKS